MTDGQLVATVVMTAVGIVVTYLIAFFTYHVGGYLLREWRYRSVRKEARRKLNRLFEKGKL